jgi:hypothetical protein
VLTILSGVVAETKQEKKPSPVLNTETNQEQISIVMNRVEVTDFLLLVFLDVCEELKLCI